MQQLIIFTCITQFLIFYYSTMQTLNSKYAIFRSTCVSFSQCKHLMLFFCPLQGIFLFFLIKYKPLKYNNVYTYPDWGYGIGWFMAMSSMVCIPLGIIWMIWKTPGTFSEVKAHTRTNLTYTAVLHRWSLNERRMSHSISLIVRMPLWFFHHRPVLNDIQKTVLLMPYCV